LVSICANRIGGAIASVLTSNAIGRGFEHWSSQTKEYKLVFVASLINMQQQGEITDWLAQNQDNVSEWGDITTHGLLFQ
jgi:hypothetical protein